VLPDLVLVDVEDADKDPSQAQAQVKEARSVDDKQFPQSLSWKGA